MTSKQVASPTSEKYWAFISYRHADNKEQDRGWATWLHQEIERYEVPAELVGTENKRGDIIPERIYPVFRDEESLPADADLASSISIALDHSKFLTVLCSPRAVESKYVTQEIEHFKNSGKSDRMIAAIIAGEPEDTQQECFPVPLREVVTPDGKLSEPIAADFRLPNGEEGFTSPEAYRKQLLKTLPKKQADKQANAYDERLQLMKLKIIAGILGTPLDTLRNRDKAYQLQLAKKRQQKLTAVITAVSLLALAAIAASFFAISQQKLADKNAQQARKQTELSTQREKETQKALTQSRFNEGKAWLERASLQAEKGNSFAAAMMAARAIGFEGYGREDGNDRYPVLISKDHPEEYAKASQTIKQHLQQCQLPLWSSPTRKQHSDTIHSIAFSPDGTTIVSGSEDKTVRLWDIRTGKPIGQALKGHSDSVTSVTFSPNGKTIASASRDKTIRLWDICTEKPIGQPLKGHSNYITSVAFNPDGTTIASASSDQTIRLWNARTGKLLGQSLKGHSNCVTSVTFSPDGKTIASASYDKTIRLWDVHTGKPVGQVFEGHSSYVTSVAFSPDGKTIASASRDKTIRLWNVLTGKPVGQPLKGHSFWVDCAVFSPDGSIIASVSRDQTIWLWDVRTGKPLGQPLKGHSNVAFNPDGTTIASASSDQTIRLWDTRTGKPVGQPLKGHSFWVNCAVFSPDGKIIASVSSDQTIRLWDARTGKPIGQALKGHSEEVASVAFSPDGKIIASASYDKTIRLWNVLTGKPLGQPLKGHSSYVNSVAFSPDGKTIASASSDQTIRLWDVRTGKPLGQPLKGHSEEVASAAFSPDGKIIASASHDKTIRLWDIHTGKPVGQPLKGHSLWVKCAVFSPAGTTIASASYDKTIRLWDVRTGKPVGQTLQGHSSGINSVAFSPDGMTIASVSSDQTIRLWDARSGKPVWQVFEGHSVWIPRVAFSPDDKTIASTSRDNTIELWDTRSGKPVGQALKGHLHQINSVAFSPDGKTIASASDDKTVRLWDAHSGKSIGPPFLGHSYPVKRMAFNADGLTIISTSKGNTTLLWDTLTHKTTRKAFGPAHTAIYSASWDKAFLLWEVIPLQNIDLLTYLENGLYQLTETTLECKQPISGLFGHTSLPIVNLPPNALNSQSTQTQAKRLEILLKANNWPQLIREYEQHQESIPKNLQLSIAQSILTTAAHDCSSNAPRMHMLLPQLIKIAPPDLVATGKLDLALRGLLYHFRQVKNPALHKQYWPTVQNLIQHSPRLKDTSKIPK